MNSVYININHLDDFCAGLILFPGKQLLLRKDHNSPYDDEDVYVKTSKIPKTMSILQNR